MNRKQRRYYGLSLAAVLTLGCMADQEQPGVANSGAYADHAQWQERCERALTHAQPAPPVINSHILVADRELNLLEHVGSIAGLSIDSSLNQILVLDALEGRIVSFDSLGEPVSQFGRLGDGPGEFRFDPIRGFRNNRLAMIGDTLVLVADNRMVQAYTRDGQYIRRLLVDPIPGAFYLDQSLGVIQGDVIVTSSGRMLTSDTSRSIRTRLRLILLDLSRSVSSPPQNLAILRNDFVMLPPFERYPEQRPYRNAYRRSWGTGANRIAFVSRESFGVCFMDLEGHLDGAYRSAAARLPVDDAEKQRVMKKELGGADHVLPFLHVTARELYQGKWPEFGPLYTNLAVSTDGTAWALRRIPGGRHVFDLYSPTAGYLMTVAPPTDVGALALVVDRTAWFVDSSTLTLYAYRVDLPVNAD